MQKSSRSLYYDQVTTSTLEFVVFRGDGVTQTCFLRVEVDEHEHSHFTCKHKEKSGWCRMFFRQKHSDTQASSRVLGNTCATLPLAQL